MAKKTNWLLIILGIIVFVVIVGVGACAGFAYYMYRQTEFTTVKTDNPEADFAKMHDRFAGQTPYVEVPRDRFEDPIIHHELEKTEKTTLDGVYMMAYNPREKTLVHFRIPGWLLRLSGSKPVNFNTGGSGSGFDVGVRSKFTVEDLERFGKGLVLDITKPTGERVLIWTE